VPSTNSVRGAGLAFLFAVAGPIGCAPIPEDRECGDLREIGLAGKKTEVIREWIQSTLADPTVLAESGAKSGRLRGGDFDVGFNWEGLGVDRGRMIIEFDGRDLDYTALDRSAVEAVIIGRGNGYKLIFIVDPHTDIEARLIEASKKPYGEIKIETLAPDLLLVCQVNRFG
jgi:hypothetical protein